MRHHVEKNAKGRRTHGLGCEGKAPKPRVETLVHSCVDVLEARMSVDVNLRRVVAGFWIQARVMIPQMKAIEDERAIGELKIH